MAGGRFIRRGIGVLLLALTLALWASAGAASASGQWRPGVRAAVRFAHARLGQVRFEVRTDTRKWGFHIHATVPSASVLKAMLLVAYLDDSHVRNRPLRASDRRLIDPMIERSDNVAATRVLAIVGPGRVRAVARRAHMRRFRLDTGIWGLSRIDADDQARFFLHIDERVAPLHRSAAMHLLASVIPSQRWGIGTLRFPGWRLYFKGGWGSGTGAVDHQVALLTRGTERLSVAVLTTDSPSHAYAKETLRGIFARLFHTMPSAG